MAPLPAAIGQPQNALLLSAIEEQFYDTYHGKWSRREATNKVLDDGKCFIGGYYLRFYYTFLYIYIFNLTKLSLLAFHIFISSS